MFAFQGAKRRRGVTAGAVADGICVVALDVAVVEWWCSQEDERDGGAEVFMSVYRKYSSPISILYVPYSFVKKYGGDGVECGWCLCVVLLR